MIIRSNISLHNHLSLLFFLQSQYIYIHESLAEYIQCGDTSFPINDVHHVLQELCENAKLKRQFDVSVVNYLLLYISSH